MEGDAENSRPVHSASAAWAGATAMLQRRKPSLEPFTHISQGAGCLSFHPKTSCASYRNTCVGGGEGRLGVRQCAAHSNRTAELALPRPLSRECLLLSQTLQEAPLMVKPRGSPFSEVDCGGVLVIPCYGGPVGPSTQ